MASGRLPARIKKTGNGRNGVVQYAGTGGQTAVLGSGEKTTCSRCNTQD
jgi:hypothetical protein